MNNLVEGCKVLEKELFSAGNIDWQDGEWWLFQHSGDGVISGKTIQELLENLGDFSIASEKVLNKNQQLYDNLS